MSYRTQGILAILLGVSLIVANLFPFVPDTQPKSDAYQAGRLIGYVVFGGGFILAGILSIRRSMREKDKEDSGDN